MRTSRTAVVAAGALFLSLAWPLLTGRVFWEDDLGTFHIPLRYLYQQALAAGDSLLWTPAILSGFYVHGEGQIGLFHPFHLVLYRLLPLTLAINLELLSIHAFGFGGMYILLRRWKLDPQAALFGAMTFAFGTFLVLHDRHLNLDGVAAHLPWLLAAVDALAYAPNARRRTAAYAAAALLVASQILLGFPQGLWFNLLTAGTFTVFTAFRSRPAVLVAGAAAMLTGVIMGGIQLMPTLDAAQASIRPWLGPAFSATLSLHPANLIQLVSPYILTPRVYNPIGYPFLHEYAVYPSAALVILPFWITIRRAQLRERHSALLFWAAVGVVALALAVGKYGGLNDLVASLPGLKWLRGSTRYLFLFHVSLVVYAAIALQDLHAVATGESASPARLWPIWIPAALSVVVTALVVSGVMPVFPPALLAPLALATLGPAIFIGVTLVTAAGARGWRFAVPVLVVLTAIDLGRSGVYEVYRVPPRTIASLAADLPDSGARAEGRVFAVGESNIDVLALKGFRLSSGYVALEPATHLDPASDVALRLSGTAWRWNGGTTLAPVPAPLPRARMLTDTLFVRLHPAGDSRGAQLQMIAVDVARTAIVDRPVPELSGPNGRTHVLVDRPGHIVIDTDASGTQVLALTERFHPGWRVTIDGQPADTLRIEGDFLGCVVPAGTRRVELRFAPASFTEGAAMSGLGVVLLVIGCAVMMKMSPPARMSAATAPAAAGA
jgi:hypothetical protein